jgi:predicted nucleic acid-binding protein
VKAFLDTSVLVAAFYADHQHHEASLTLFAKQTKSAAATAAHCMAEFYAVVTGMPGKNRASPHEALLFIEDAHERLTLISLNEREYLDAIGLAAAAGISGGALYDALIARCALKAKVQALYTWNGKHFERIPEIAPRIRLP